MGSQLKSPPGRSTTICPWPPCCQGTARGQRHTGRWKSDQLEHDHDKHGRDARVGVDPSWPVSDQPAHPLNQKLPLSAAHHLRRDTRAPPQITSEHVSKLSNFDIPVLILLRLIGKELSRRLIRGVDLHFPHLRVHLVNIETIVSQNQELITQVDHHQHHCIGSMLFSDEAPLLKNGRKSGLSSRGSWKKRIWGKVETCWWQPWGDGRPSYYGGKYGSCKSKPFVPSTFLDALC